MRDGRKEQGINTIEIVGKHIDECRTIEQLREYIIKQISIYENLLKLIDKEFNHEEIKNIGDHRDLNYFVRALRRLA